MKILSHTFRRPWRGEDLLIRERRVLPQVPSFDRANDGRARVRDPSISAGCWLVRGEGGRAHGFGLNIIRRILSCSFFIGASIFPVFGRDESPDHFFLPLIVPRYNFASFSIFFSLLFRVLTSLRLHVMSRCST